MSIATQIPTEPPKPAPTVAASTRPPAAAPAPEVESDGSAGDWWALMLGLATLGALGIVHVLDVISAFVSR